MALYTNRRLWSIHCENRRFGAPSPPLHRVSMYLDFFFCPRVSFGVRKMYEKFSGARIEYFYEGITRFSTEEQNK